MESNEHKHHLSEEERQEVRSRTNARIAHWCSFAALLVILVDLAAFAIGKGDSFWTLVGIMLAIALLAIAMINNPTSSTKK